MRRLDITQQRLANQHIGFPGLKKPADVVRWLVAVQAQDYAGAKWALGLRLKRATETEIEQAFTDGSILRTHLMRPTWHFVTSADIRWLLALTSPRVHSINAHMYRKLELDDTIFKRSNATLAKALRGGQTLTRDELRSVLEREGIAVNGDLRMSYFMMRAELDAIVCSGPRRGKQFTYALLDERVPETKTRARDEALVELARRYFVSRGPATVQDFAKWSGLTVIDGRNGLEGVKRHLQCEIVAERSYWFPTSIPDAGDASPNAHLLSIYDEYISSYKDRSAMVSESYAAKLSGLGNALSYIVVIDGQIVGTWKRTITKNSVTIEPNFFKRLTPAERQAVEIAAQRYAQFVGLPLVSVKASHR